jgi:hypothetical protein
VDQQVIEVAAWNYVVAWIDLLGQSDLLVSLPQINLSSDDKRKFEKAGTNLHVFREELFSLKDSVIKMIEKTKGWKPGIELHVMADSAQFAISFEKKTDVQTLAEINVLLYALNSTMLALLAKSLPVRGAIELGLCLRTQQGEIYGTAVARAVMMEKKAIYPRVAIGGNLVEYLKSSLNNTNALECLRLIDADEDGFLILNYAKDFKDKMQKVIGPEDQIKPALMKARKFIEESKEKYKAKFDFKLVQKYSYLERFFKRNHIWDIS